MPRIKKDRLRGLRATIYAAKADIQILRIDNKQVTLSVFRQLKSKSIFPGNYSDDWFNQPLVPLRGITWGIVMYLWRGCPSWAGYHLVWQLGDELRRMPIPFAKSLHTYYETKDEEPSWGCSLCGVDLIPNEVKCDVCGKRYGPFIRKTKMRYDEGFIHDIFGYSGWQSWDEMHCHNRKNHEDKYTEECRMWCESVKSKISEFEALPQLFIAV